MLVVEKVEAKDDQVPKWAVKALLWTGVTMFSILCSILGYIGMSFDSRLVRIEDILLHRPIVVSGGIINEPEFSHQENPHAQRLVEYP